MHISEEKEISRREPEESAGARKLAHSCVRFIRGTKPGEKCEGGKARGKPGAEISKASFRPAIKQRRRKRRKVRDRGSAAKIRGGGGVVGVGGARCNINVVK